MNNRRYIDIIKDHFYYASRPVCGKEIMESTGINKQTVYGAIHRLHDMGFIKEVQSPEHPNRYYVLNIRTYNPLDSWLPNTEIIQQVMAAIGRGARFSDLLTLPYSKETITVYLRALFAERIIGIKNRKYYLLEKDPKKVRLADLKQYPTLRELKKMIKPVQKKKVEPVKKENIEWDEKVFDQVDL